MGLIDTHLHLDGFARKGELPAVLARASDAGVEAMIAIGTEPEDWVLHRGLAADHPGVIFFTVGLHPCTVDELWSGAVDLMRSFWNQGQLRPVALGECGLDRFHLPKEPEAAARILGWQKDAFRVQLALARELGCPVVVHSRGAFAETVEMIDASGVDWTKVIFHCFAEGAPEMAVLLERGGWGSFTGILTYKNAENIRQAAQLQGLDRFMVETDAPYLTPVPHRGKPNEPAYVRHTAEFAASAVFGVPYPELEAKTRELSRRLFGL